MSNTALITGASSGIGKELARYHANKGGDLILTARRSDELAQLKGELEGDRNIEVHTISLNLASEGGARRLYDDVKSLGLRPDILINNAGFGGHGLHIDRPLEDELAMIDLNVKALVTLTRLFARDMAEQGGGKILNVGSSAGFMPGPKQAVYFATKAFVNSFSQAIDEELRGRGVTCTVLTPGYVATEFAKVANLQGTQLVKQKGDTAECVAKIGYDAMLAGKLVVINELPLGVMLNWVVPFLPRRVVLKMVSKMQAK